MALTFLGVGGAFNPEMGNNSAYFIREKHLYLLDCGELVFGELMRRGLLKDISGLTVLLTHLHADHCGSLGTLFSYANALLGITPTLVHPGNGAPALLSLMGVAASRYKLLPSLDEGDVTAAPVPVRHSEGMAAYAYLITMDGETIYYGGDAGDPPSPEVLGGLRSGSIARAYLDVSDFGGNPPENPGHLPLSVLAAIAEPALRERITLMHLNRDYRAQAESMGFQMANKEA
ncbi:MAG: MBL fold metallo-hydrolase [Oscillospiraceae bacterium]|jgi:L-ascorbate metabolism protein UlaG (beta-lactamase superfamily)|nr:MBL fold metallo-hydrolase [Oscillospiraceae bacterium]